MQKKKIVKEIATYSHQGMYFDVVVNREASNRYLGKRGVLIMPVAGYGEAWVMEESLTKKV